MGMLFFKKKQLFTMSYLKAFLKFCRRNRGPLLQVSMKMITIFLYRIYTKILN